MVETDMTLFYRLLAKIDMANGKEAIEHFSPAFYISEQITADYQARFDQWIEQYCQRIQRDGKQDDLRINKMNAVNPKYVLRNYLAQLAIDKAEQGDFSGVNELLEVLRRPYQEQPGKEEFAAKRPDWARQRPGCSMLSCSS
jgi:uncharacterized protein YdiU (UPF0061 family)